MNLLERHLEELVSASPIIDKAYGVSDANGEVKMVNCEPVSLWGDSPGDFWVLGSYASKASSYHSIVLKSVDTCAPQAPNFGVPDENVYK